LKGFFSLSFLLWTLVSCSNPVPPASTVMPAETLKVLPASVPTLQALGSAVPDPQEDPVQEWRGIPILPEAVAGQEFPVNNVYSFVTQVTPQEVQAFYDERLTQLGWSQPFDNSYNENGGTMTFRKEESSLAITVSSSGDSTVVLLVMTLA